MRKAARADDADSVDRAVASVPMVSNQSTGTLRAHGNSPMQDAKPNDPRPTSGSGGLPVTARQVPQSALEPCARAAIIQATAASKARNPSNSVMVND